MNWKVENLPPGPDPDRGLEVLEELSRFAAENPGADAEAFLQAAAIRSLLKTLASHSPFLTQLMRLNPAFVLGLPAQEPDDHLATLISDMDTLLRATGDRASVMRILRQTRNKVALLVATADLAGHWDLEQVTNALSDFAESAINLATGFLLRERMVSGDLAWPRADDEPLASGLAEGTGYVVLALGKLGGRELNYSSDIDLIVLYDEEVIQYRGRKSPGDCFVKLTQALVQLLDLRTQDGYVFRTDLRLRPDPGATPLAISMGAAEVYYQSLAQNWERSAMIKARVVGGDHAAGNAYLRRLHPFVWRKNLDFVAMQDIQAIKQQIHRHHHHGEAGVAGHDVKLGRGSIREIEFFAQIHQLIAGGRDPRLRPIATCDALGAILDAGRIDAQTYADLTTAYRFFRTVEHRLQMVADEQTHRMPDDDAGVAAIAAFSGYTDVDRFKADFRHHTSKVQRYYDALLPEAAAADGELAQAADGLLNDMKRRSFNDPENAAEIISRWRTGRYRALHTERGRRLLEQCLPRLLDAMDDTNEADIALARFDGFLAKLPAGVQLFSLFLSNPALIRLIARIMSLAPALAERLSTRAHLLDAVLDPAFFEPLPDTETLRQDLTRQLRQADIYEDQLDICRRWVHDLRFRVGVQVLEGLLPATESGGSFARIAETVVVALIPVVTDKFAKKHGGFEGCGLAVLALGKLGGHELSYGSDLDLIFLYTAGQGTDSSDGEKPLSPSQYFSRLGTHVITAITALTAEGRLYEVDMRLRPSGGAGPLVVTLETFSDYQRQNAWTWEHMALTRARLIFGPKEFGEAVMAEIQAVLAEKRDEGALLTDVAEMRKRLYDEFGSVNSWAVKHVHGGIVDIEFICQYLLLRHAHDDHRLLHPSIPVALGACTAQGALAEDHRVLLVAAYELMQTVQGILRLCQGENLDEAAFSDNLKRTLARSTGHTDFMALKATLEKTQENVHALYHRLIGTEKKD